ncbi:MAG: DUF2723 domain-containing protein, partial [Bdellovibrionota bacterium]
MTAALGIGFFVALAALYFMRLPTTVQFGDTGELVMAAVGRFVAHPPGYPLWVWFQELMINVLPVKTEYWRAAFVNSIFSLVAFWFMWLHLERGLLAFALVAALAFSRVVWRYSLLPDVFALHILFTSIVLYLYFQQGRKPWHGPAMVFAFCVAFSHHLTIVFLTPIVWHVMWRDRRQPGIWLALVAGSAVSAAFYLSLQLRNPEHLFSWGEITSFEAVVDHFLRRDYGTFQLVGTNQEGSLLANIAALLRTLADAFWALAVVGVGLAAAVVVSRSRKKNSETAPENRPLVDLYDALTLLSLALYVVIFLALSNTPLDGYRIEVIERFFIMVEVILCFAIGRLILKVLARQPKLHTQIAAGLLAIAAVVNFARYQKFNDFSQNHIVEEYLRNFFAEAPTNRKVVMITATDTRYFGARFAQAVLKVSPEVMVTSPKVLIFQWAAKKFVRETGLSFDMEKVLRLNHLDLTSDLVMPNLDRVHFLSLYPL